MPVHVRCGVGREGRDLRVLEKLLDVFVGSALGVSAHRTEGGQGRHLPSL